MTQESRDLPSLRDVTSFEGKRVLLRADLNVPIADGEIADDYRIQTSFPTIQWLMNAGAHVTICSHLGRPDPRPDFEKPVLLEAESKADQAADPQNKFSMELVGKRLQDTFPEISVLENLRFSPGEEACEEDFILELIAEKDIYVNDAFGACHREHASIVGPPKYLPSVAGLLLEKEVQILKKLLENISHPFVVLLGGAKVKDKLALISELLKKADVLAIGGAMAFTFLVAKGFEIHDDLVDESRLDEVRELLEGELGHKIHLPEDLTALSVEGTTEQGVRQMGTNVPPGWEARDIGPGTAAAFSELIETAGSVFWNGPVGVFEDPRFLAGTQTVATAIAAASSSSGVFSVVGGGDSASAIRGLGLEDEITHLSTGGGATLKFMEKSALVGTEALMTSENLQRLADLEQT